MRARRIYLPLSHDQVRALAADRVLVAPIKGFAAGQPGRVDARLSPAAAEEEVEYLAFAAAADLAHDGGSARRVIASADAPTTAIQETPDSGPDGTIVISVTADLPLRHFVSVHIDESEPTSSGTQDLLWYDITELDTVLAELGAG